MLTQRPWLAVVAVLNTVVSLFYYLGVIAPMELDPAEGRLHTLGRLAAGTAITAAAATVGIGVAAEALLGVLRDTRPLP